MNLHDKYGSWVKRSYFKTTPFSCSVANQILMLCIIASVKNELDKILIHKDIISTDKLLQYAKDIVIFFKEKYNYELSFFNNVNFNKSHFQGQEAVRIKNIQTMNFEKILDGEKCGLEDDILGYIYSFVLFNYEKGYMQNRGSYYTSTQTIHSLLKENFVNGTKVFDPFCGAGRILFNEHGIKSYGSDLDKFAVDVANLNSWLLQKVFSQDLEVCTFTQQDFYTITDKHDYIFTNIPFDASIKKEAEILNKIDDITNYKAVVIIPGGHFVRMVDKKLLTGEWNLIKKLDSNEFKPFTTVLTEVIALQKY